MSYKARKIPEHWQEAKVVFGIGVTEDCAMAFKITWQAGLEKAGLQATQDTMLEGNRTGVSLSTLRPDSTWGRTGIGKTMAISKRTSRAGIEERSMICMHPRLGSMYDVAGMDEMVRVDWTMETGAILYRHNDFLDLG